MQTKLSIFCAKVIEAGWLAATVAVPLFFNIYTARTFEPDKLTLMRSIVSVMILAWIIKVLEEARTTSDDRPLKARLTTWLKQPLVLPSVAIFLVYLVSTILSISPLVSIWGSYQRMQGFYTFASYMVIFGLMATQMRTREQVDRFISTIIIASVPVALYGIIQRNGLDPLPWAGDVVRRVASNMGNAIFVASYLIMIVPLTISRLIRSMTAIVTQEESSWGHTILAAVYIFVLAVQVLCILYSGSRGPQIGLLGAVAVMGLLILLQLRQQSDDPSSLSLAEIGKGVLPVVLITVLGTVGYFIGGAMFSLVGVGLGLVIYVAGAGYLAATEQGYRWLWVSWPALGAVALAFIITLNIPGGPLDSFREVPYLGRLGQITQTDSGTGQVRVLIWDAAIDLVMPHRPLGVEGEFTDSFNSIRPLIGYGPESMFNAFAYVYPPGLANIEARGSSADRSHNETMDSLVLTGFIGFLAFYFLMISLFYYLTKWLGWIPDRGAQMRAIGLMVAGGLIGTFIPYFVDGSFVLSAVGLPFGVFGGILLFIGVQGLLAQSEGSEPTTLEPLLLIGVFGAFMGHFLEVHFVFSIAATYTYFWAYLGLAVAMAAIKRDPMAEVEPGISTVSEPEETETRRSSRSRRRRRGGRNRSARTTAGSGGPLQENWETWILAQGLAMSIIFIILTFDFVPVQFDISTGNYSIVWLMSITYLVGTAIIFSELAIKQAMWQKVVNWGRAVLLYAVTSIGYAGFYILVHSQQRAFLTSGRVQQGVSDQVELAMRAAGALVNLLGGFYIFLFLLMLVIAFALVQGRHRGLRLWRSNNLLIYVPLIVATVLVIFFKNFNVVKADIYLKEGDRYRSQQLWDQAEALHQAAIAADSDEDFYYLMLALDYQMKAQDGRLSAEVRERAWLQGEQIALQARNINKYNPDNTGNLGRYYFTLGQVLDRSYYDSAIEYFEKAVQLAPQNVVYYNLLGQVHYVQSNFAEAIDWLEQSAELDPLYEPTYILLGDTYAAQGEVDGALAAHQEAIRLSPNSFTDANFDTRLNFYVSRSMPQGNPTEALTDTQELETPPAPEVGERPVDKLIEAFEDYAADHPEVAQTYWAIGHIYSRMNDLESAQDYFDQALNIQSDNQRQQRANQQVNNRVAQSLVQIGNAYLNEENYENAEAVYNQALSVTPNQAEAWSSLGFIYARTDRVQEAIQANQRVLEIRPNDYSSLKNLALLYQQVGQLDQAVAYTQQALTQAPEAERESLETFLTQLQTQQSGGGSGDTTTP